MAAKEKQETFEMKSKISLNTTEQPLEEEEEEELVDIKAQSGDILARLAAMKPDRYPRYNPRPRPDTASWVHNQSRGARRLVNNQGRYLGGLRKLHGELEEMDREIAGFKTRMSIRPGKPRAKYQACQEGVDFVCRYDDYTMEEF